MRVCSQPIAVPFTSLVVKAKRRKERNNDVPAPLLQASALSFKPDYVESKLGLYSLHITARYRNLTSSICALENVFGQLVLVAVRLQPRTFRSKPNGSISQRGRCLAARARALDGDAQDGR